MSSNFRNFRHFTTKTLVKFKYLILDKFEPVYKLHELQFGLTPGGGCANAIHAFRSAVEYLVKYCSLVYAAALNISKACDRLNQCRVTLKAKKLNINVGIIVMLLVSASLCRCALGRVLLSNFLLGMGLDKGKYVLDGY